MMNEIQLQRDLNLNTKRHVTAGPSTPEERKYHRIRRGLDSHPCHDTLVVSHVKALYSLCRFPPEAEIMQHLFDCLLDRLIHRKVPDR